MAPFKTAVVDLNISTKGTSKINASTRIVFSSQDKGTARFQFNIKNNGVILPLHDVEGEIVLLMTGDSKDVDVARVVDAEKGTMEYILTDKQLTHIGNVYAELILKYKTGEKIGGLEFDFSIERARLDQVIEPSKEYYVATFEELEQNIHNRATAIEEVIDQLEDGVTESVVVQVETAKTDSTGQAHANIDSRIKAEVGKINTKQGELTAALADTMNFLSDIGVNVMKWGAKGDGITDDAPAIRNAISYLREKGGGTLYFPAPEESYLLNSFDPLTDFPKVNFWVNFSNLTILGQNKATLKVANGKSGEAIFGNYYTETLSNIKVDGITFDLNGKNNLQTENDRSSKAGFLTYWCNDLEIKNCKFIDAPGEHCIYVGAPTDTNNGQNIRIHNNDFYNVADSLEGNHHNEDHSSIFVTGSNIWIYNNNFVNTNQSRRATAIEAEGKNIYEYDNYIEKYNIAFLTITLMGPWAGESGLTRNIVVDNVHIHSNTVKTCLDGWWFENTILNGFKNVKFYNNIIELHDNPQNGTRYGVRGGDYVLFPMENIEIYHNSFTTDTDYSTTQGATSGIQIEAGRNISIKNNHIYNLSGFAIRIRSTKVDHVLSDTEITGNKIQDVCVNSVEGYEKAISIQSPTNRLKIVNNKIDNIRYTSAKVGIELYAGDDFKYHDILIQDNQINVATTDIQTWTINLNISDQIIVLHHTHNDKFEVLYQVTASRGSVIENHNSNVKHVKSDTWKTYDQGTTPPTSGQRYQNDYRTNTNKTELGTSPNKYIVKGWECIVSGTPGTWREDRALTGN